MAREWRATVALALVAALALVGAIEAQHASAEGIASGTTRVELYGNVFRALKKEGVRVTKIGPGSVKDRVIKLPVTGGALDVATANGWIDSGGGFRFQVGKRSVKLKQVTLDTSKGALRATLAGQRMELAEVEGYEFSRLLWGDAIRVPPLRLKQRVSNLLNRKLGLDVFRPNQRFALVSSSLQPTEVQIAGGSFQLDFDAATVAKVRSLGVELLPLESSSSGSEPPVFSGSLIHGRIDPTMARTWGNAEGGFRITDPEAPSPSVDWWNLGFSFETGKLLSMGLAHSEAGQVVPPAPGPLAAVDLSGATVTVDAPNRTVTVTNAGATLEAGVADYVNETFAKPKGKAAVLSGGDPLGTFSMTMQGR